MPLIQEVDVKVKELRQTISGLNNHQMSLKASIKKMKEKAKEMDEKVWFFNLEPLSMVNLIRNGK